MAATSSTSRSSCSRSVIAVFWPRTTPSSKGKIAAGSVTPPSPVTRFTYQGLDRARLLTSQPRFEPHLPWSRNGSSPRHARGWGRTPTRSPCPDPQVSSEVGIGVNLPHRRGSVRDPRSRSTTTAALLPASFVKPLVNLIWLVGHRFPARLGDRAVARRARAAPPRCELRRGRHPRSRQVSTRAHPGGGCWPSLCVVLVALPFLREPEPFGRARRARWPERRHRLALAEERDRALAALKELEADHRAGRVNDEDYRAWIGPLRREAAEALRALDKPGKG